VHHTGHHLALVGQESTLTGRRALGATARVDGKRGAVHSGRLPELPVLNLERDAAQRHDKVAHGMGIAPIAGGPCPCSTQHQTCPVTPCPAGVRPSWPYIYLFKKKKKKKKKCCKGEFGEKLE
jgi:hypothetical protein